MGVKLRDYNPKNKRCGRVHSARHGHTCHLNWLTLPSWVLTHGGWNVLTDSLAVGDTYDHSLIHFFFLSLLIVTNVCRSNIWKFAKGPLPARLPVSEVDEDWTVVGIASAL